MHVRIARFEGTDPGKLDQLTDELRGQMAAMRSGELPAEAPPEARTLMDTVTRFLQLVDRETGATVGIAFADSEEQMRRADEALNAMSPPGESGMRRTSVDIYEVVLDESFG